MSSNQWAGHHSVFRAESYAIKWESIRQKSTAENVANIKRQMQEIAAIYDWDMEVNTTNQTSINGPSGSIVQMFEKGSGLRKGIPH